MTKQILESAIEKINVMIKKAKTDSSIDVKDLKLVCPECKSTDCKTAIHTDYKECNNCWHYWKAN